MAAYRIIIQSTKHKVVRVDVIGSYSIENVLKLCFGKDFKVIGIKNGRQHDLLADIGKIDVPRLHDATEGNQKVFVYAVENPTQIPINDDGSEADVIITRLPVEVD